MAFCYPGRDLHLSVFCYGIHLTHHSVWQRGAEVPNQSLWNKIQLPPKIVDAFVAAIAVVVATLLLSFCHCLGIWYQHLHWTTKISAIGWHEGQGRHSLNTDGICYPVRDVYLSILCHGIYWTHHSAWRGEQRCQTSHYEIKFNCSKKLLLLLLLLMLLLP